jgi:hypothetical protein
MKKLKELPKTVVNCRTQEEYNELMDIYTQAGWKWSWGDIQKDVHGWKYYEEETCIDVEDGFTFGPAAWHREEGYTILSFPEFKAKYIDDMIETIEERIDSIVNEYCGSTNKEMLRIDLKILVAMAEKEQIEKDLKLIK